MTRQRGALVVSVALLAFAASANEAATAAKARFNYLLHCAGCHLPDGRGAPPEVPTLVGELGQIVALDRGRDYLVRVPGASQAPISDGELADVVNWVLREFNGDTLPRRFQPLTADEVAEARRRVLADPLRFRASLWPEAY